MNKHFLLFRPLQCRLKTTYKDAKVIDITSISGNPKRPPRPINDKDSIHDRKPGDRSGTSEQSRAFARPSKSVPESTKRPQPSYRSRVRSWNNHYQVIEGEWGLFHKEIPFGNWRAGAFVNFWPTVPYVPEGFNDRRTVKSEVTGEEYTIGTTDYAVTRIAECGGLDSYILDTPEEEIDSQFGVDLKRLMLQILETEKVLSEPITTADAVKDALKLEAILGFKLSITDQLVNDLELDPELLYDL